MARLTKRCLYFCLTALLWTAATPTLAQWKADKPIRIIVPWPVGGSTDQMVRVTATAMEKTLGQPVTVVNQPGSSGAIGTQNVLDTPHDGYTFSAGAVKDLGSYKLLGMVDTTLADWRLYLTVAHVAVVSVNAKLPYRSMAELLTAMRNRPGEIRVATAGMSSSGNSAMQAITRTAGVQPAVLTYDGGRPAVLAAVTGEADMTTQLAAEQIYFIKAGRLRPLAVVSEKPLYIEGFGEVESLATAIPGFKDPPNYFGIFVPKDVPAPMLRALDALWANKVAASEDLQQYARTHGARLEVSYGEEAVQKSMPALRAYAWGNYTAGRTKISPASVGIPAPDR